MSFLPIVTRELRLAARRPNTYRLRLLAALAMAAITVSMILSSQRPPSQLGRELFAVLSGLGFAYALLSGVGCTADSLSQEKRDGTLGLLFLTNLRGFDVVLGKLVVTSLSAAYILVASLPILALPVLFGAVTGSEFWRMNLLLLQTLIFSLATGLLVSTFGKTERGVMLTTFFVLICLNFGFPLLWKAITLWWDSRWWDVLLLFPSAAYGFRMVTDSAIRTASQEYQASMLMLGACSVTMISVSSLLLPRFTQEKTVEHVRGAWKVLQHYRFGEPELARFRKADLLDSRPFLWLLSRDRLPAFWMTLLVGVTILFAIWIPSAFRPQRTPATPIAIFGAMACHLIYKALAAADACRQFNQDKRSGTLELLLSTPLTISALIGDQAARMQRMFLAPLLALGVVNLGLMTGAPNNNGDEVPIFLGGFVIAGFDLYALTWVGMLTGLRENRYAPAVLRTLGAVMVGPWVAFAFFMFAGPRQSSTVVAFFFWWFLVSGILDVSLARWARAQITSRFREFVANDFTPVRLLNLGPPPNPNAPLVPLRSIHRPPPFPPSAS